jgi:hypothetical protein
LGTFCRQDMKVPIIGNIRSAEPANTIRAIVN